jgi:polysaccharide export outer membrane protein
MKSLALVSILLAAGLGLLACAHNPNAANTGTAEQTPAAQDSGYILQPGDVLEISVWKEKDLQRDVVVLPDGSLSFPLAGEIQASNKTVEQLRKEISTRLAKYIPGAVVTVSAKQIQGNKIYVVGKVNRPGEFITSRYVDVMQAISIAGGVTPFAAVNSIQVLRRVNGVQTAIPFKYSKVESGSSLESNIILQSGDVVVVP